MKSDEHGLTFPLSHKTVIVLDHGSDFLASSQQMIDLDWTTKTRTLIPLVPISKSLWSCSVESAVEYCRIVWDIFPSGRLIRLVIGDGEDTRFVNTWGEQSVNQVMSSFGKIAPPSTPKNKLDIVRAVEMALGTLCEPSEIQHERRTNLELQTEVINRGRVIVISQLQGETETIKLEKKIYTTLDVVNKVATQDDKQIPLQEVEIVLIHTSPGTKELFIAPSQRKYGDILKIEAHKVTSGHFLADKMVELAQVHYDLAITTVTGIPMKEEQNANSSANYDVELLHPAAAHSDFKANQNEEKHEVTLKWCTPRTAPSHELHYCTAAFRITPVEINSRPSSCLTNFLLTGRTVMLELPRKSGSKLLSHMLASHGGEIYIHTLGTGRSALEDPPSISEGTGGRVTDYRITDFGTFMKDHTLIPYDTTRATTPEFPLDMTLASIERTTLYWPLVISSTSVYNVQSHLEPLLSIIVKPIITLDQVVECKKVILNMMLMETKGTALPLSSGSAGPRGKSGPKKEEQYRALWAELEQLVRLYCSTSEHQEVLECLLDCRKSEANASLEPSKAVKIEAKSSNSNENPITSEDVKPKKLKVAPELLGRTSLLGLIKDNMSRKPATSMWQGYNPETNKTQLYKNVKDKLSRDDNVPMEIP